MPDPIYADSRLASVYDAFDDDRCDLYAYLDVVNELGAEDVLDIGCGTGSLAVMLSYEGCRVTGLDPAAASLEIAKRKPGAAAVTWIQGRTDALPPLGADVALMTGNVAQVFLTDQEWSMALSDIGAALRPGGHLVFESRRPEHEVWKEWAEDDGPRRRTIDGIGEVVERRELTRVDPPFVSFRLSYSFVADGLVLSSDTTLRFRSREELEQSLANNGFETPSVRDAPDRPGRELVFVAQRP